MRRSFLVRAFGLLGACAVLVFGLREVSRRLVFPTYRVERRAPPSDVAMWTLHARDGAVVHALELPGSPTAKVFVYFHNNRETMVSGVALGRELARRGFGVVLPEYRGYGLSEGLEPTEEGLYSDAEAVLDALAERRVGPDRVVLWGQSLGTGVAAEMARRGRGSALVLVAPYTSLPDVVSAVVPGVPARVLLPDHFETLKKSASISVPTLVIHGDADEVIPFWMGRRVSAAITKAQFLAVPGGHHGDLFARSPETLIDAMAALGRPG